MPKRKPKLPPNPTPWPCAVLAVDPGATSGWAVWNLGTYSESGEVRADQLGEHWGSYHEISHLIRGILERCESEAVLVMERPFGRLSAVGGLIAAASVWKQAWINAGGSARRIVRVYPATWRAAELGGKYAVAKRDAVRAAEQAYAGGLTLRADLGEDEATAVCIGRWASRAGQIGKVLPKKLTRLQ